MRYTWTEAPSKPKDWPANEIEQQLDNIQEQVNAFKSDPCYVSKEILVSLVSAYDLNQRSMCGLLRTTEYEVACINSLYIEGSMLNFNGLKTYIYELVGAKTRMQKIASWFPIDKIDLNIKQFEGLLPGLYLYYITYQKFTVEKSKRYAEQLIDIVREALKDISYNSTATKREGIDSLTHAYITLLNDISYFRCIKRTGIWAFTRDEIFELFQLAGELISLQGDSPIRSPLKGVLMTCISNYILKSRHGYNEDYICKYISQEVAKKSVLNHQIWMSVINKLNDEREQRVIPELFDESDWNSYDWATNIDFSPTRQYYVSSFCKKLNDDSMAEKYGECIYGYKDDRMADILAPIIYYTTKNNTHIPIFSQVVAFDVIYNRDEAKKEIEFLCSVINCFNISDDEKKSFLEEILQYWILSVKDSQWSYERERRYVLFMYNYDYLETVITSNHDFLKLKTSLFLMPDFILGKNPVKPYIEKMIDNKRKAISTKPYLYCKNCLNRDFDIVIKIHTPETCPICGSTNIGIEYPEQ